LEGELLESCFRRLSRDRQIFKLQTLKRHGFKEEIKGYVLDPKSASNSGNPLNGKQLNI
jgi:hypothetical protein